MTSKNNPENITMDIGLTELTKKPDNIRINGVSRFDVKLDKENILPKYSFSVFICSKILKLTLAITIEVPNIAQVNINDAIAYIEAL